MSTLRVNAIVDASGGNTATINTYMPPAPVRAWVNFNGTGTVAIRASLNVSSITDGGTGVYTVNFTTAMSDANYSAVCSGHSNGFGRQSNAFAAWNGYLTTSVVIWTGNTINAAAEDLDTINISVFR